MGRLGFYFDQTSCTGCRTCQIACCDKNNLDASVTFRLVRDYETGEYPKGGYYHLSMACNHCMDPACVRICPTGATFKVKDGTVQHDDELCINCGACSEECPYGAPQLIYGLGVRHKCDSCKVLRDIGEQPACVAACLMRCLEFGDLDELRERHKNEELVQELPCMPSASITKPSLLIHPKAAAKEMEYTQIRI